MGVYRTETNRDIHHRKPDAIFHGKKNKKIARRRHCGAWRYSKR